MAETLVSSCLRGNPSRVLKCCSQTLAPRSKMASVSAQRNDFVFRVLPVSSGTRGLASATKDAAAANTAEVEESMSIDALKCFFNLNIGKWNGFFYQFDGNGELLQLVSTKLSASSYGVDELCSLIQTLYIKQPSSSTTFSGYDSEPEWLEYKVKETNLLTVDKYQQIGFFPIEKAFSLRYQTVGMLETVLRAGVLGEDGIGEESPRNLKVPSRFPSVVCESCLYSLHKDMRARAFHIMDPKGVLDMLLIFLEQRGNAAPSITSCSLHNVPEKIIPFLGQWKGYSITKRSGVYGATIAKAEIISYLQMDDKGRIVQDITSTSSTNGSTANIHWSGTLLGNVIKYDGGFQWTLLPGGMYMGFPCDIAKNVAQSQSFHLEFCWMESPEKRQRLVRTYDTDGLAVSSTYFIEHKV